MRVSGITLGGSDDNLVVPTERGKMPLRMPSMIQNSLLWLGAAASAGGQ